MVGFFEQLNLIRKNFGLSCEMTDVSCKNEGDSFFLLGGLAASLFLVIGSNFYVGVSSISVFNYFIFTLFVLRTYHFLRSTVPFEEWKIFVCFTFAFPVLFFILGFTKIKINFLYLSPILILEGYLFLINFRKVLHLDNLMYFVLGVSTFTLFLLKVIKGYSPIWDSAFFSSGLIYFDTLRDIAAINAWDKYEALSHGVHGLMFSSYHYMFTQFHRSMLINSGGNVLDHLINFGYIFCPVYFVWGELKLIDFLGAKSAQNYKMPIIVTFLFVFSCFEYSLVQRSSMMATFLFFPMMVILFYLWEGKKIGNMIYFLVPLLLLMMYARAFSGLIFVITSTFLLFIRKNTAERIVIILSVCMSLIFLYLFFSDGGRNSGVKFTSICYVLSPLLYLPFVAGAPLVFMSIYILYSEKCFNYNFNNIWDRRKNLKILFLISAFSLSVSSLKATSLTDVLYMSIPVGWIYFYLVISEDFFDVDVKNGMNAFKRALGITINFSSDPSKCTSRRRAIVIFLIILTSSLIPSEFILAKSQLEVKYKTLNKMIADDPDVRRQVIRCNKRDFYCTKRIEKFNLGSMSYVEKYLEVNNFAKNVDKIVKSNRGIFGVYISPDSDYWQMFSTDVHPSLFLMAKIGVPLVYGLNSSNIGYSFPTVANDGGQISSFSIDNFCQNRKKLGVDNLIYVKGHQFDVVTCP